MATIKDYEGNSYDLASLQKLAQQLYGVTDLSRMSGGVFGTNKGNIGFSYEDLAAGLGGNVSTADQVLFDAARGLFSRGITDLTQLQLKDTRGDIEIQPEMRTEGDQESGNVYSVPTGKYITYVTNPDGTRTQQYVSPEVMASAQTIVDPTTGERKIVASNQVTGKNWYAGDNLLNTRQVSSSEGGGAIGTRFGLGETFTGGGKTGYELDLSSGAPKFTTYGDSTNFMDSTGGDLVKFAALVAGGNALTSSLGGAGAAAGGDAAFVAADAAQLAAQGLSQAQIEATLVSTGIDSFIAADAAQLAAQGLSGSQISSTLAAAGSTAAASGGLTAAQMANLAKAGISLAGAGGAASAIAGGGTGGFGLTQQDRSGFSSGSANYSPEYYQQIQSKYNQYMPQAKGADITADLKNWYETKYTPNATGTSGTSGGTGYTTDQSLTNLNLTKPVVPPVAPLYSGLTAGSSDTAIANAYSQFIAQNGGNTAANRQAANDYLVKLGVPQSQINTAYNTFLSKLPASGNTPSSVAANATPAQIAQAFTAYVQGSGGNTQANRTAAAEYLKSIGVPVSTIEAGYKSYLGTLPASGTSATTLNANATPAQIAQAYASYAAGAGGDTAANKQAAIEYLKNIGVSDATIQAAYPIYKSAYGGSAGGGGMLTGGGGGDDYTSLSGGSSASDIAAAYADYVAGAGGDTAANQAAAIDYLSGLGVDQGTINAAYDVYKG